MINLRFIIKKGSAVLRLFVATIIYIIAKESLNRRNIWLVSEKYPEARDNGYHLFVYIRNNHPEIEAYYVIDNNSVDLHKIQKYGNIVYSNTIKHFVFYLCAAFSISSQPGGAAPEPRGMIEQLSLTRNAKQKKIFLQHGVTKDELTHGFDYSNTKYSLFVCSSSKEQAFVHSIYKYPMDVVQNLGLCRFDNLIRNIGKTKKQILVMPTFRKWLISNNTPEEATDIEKTRFWESEYYKSLKVLLTNSVLIDYMKIKGYVLVFYPHYAMQPYINCFGELASDTVLLADRRRYDVQQLLIESSVLITDYSSVFFDFAYMEKPEIFYQFDEAQYRENHYKKGYFDYVEDGFGPVFKQVDSVVSYLIGCIDKGCRIEEKYKKRIENFFDTRDDHNCERTYESLMHLSNEGNQ